MSKNSKNARKIGSQETGIGHPQTSQGEKIMSKKLLIAAWTITVGLGLLFAHAVYAGPSKAFIEDNGATVTMDKETYTKGVNQMMFQKEQIEKLGNRVRLLEQRYKHVEDCVNNNAASGLATTPCFNVINDPSGQPLMSIQDIEDQMRFLHNKTGM